MKRDCLYFEYNPIVPNVTIVIPPNIYSIIFIIILISIFFTTGIAQNYFNLIFAKGFLEIHSPGGFLENGGGFLEFLETVRKQSIKMVLQSLE